MALLPFGETDDEAEQRLCGEFWVWLYEARDCRGQEPSDDEKHERLRPLREFRTR